MRFNHFFGENNRQIFFQSYPSYCINRKLYIEIVYTIYGSTNLLQSLSYLDSRIVQGRDLRRSQLNVSL